MVQVKSGVWQELPEISSTIIIKSTRGHELLGKTYEQAYRLASYLGNASRRCSHIYVLGLGFSTYKVLTGEDEAEMKLTPQERFTRDIEALKKRINLQELGKHDMKEIFNFLMQQTQIVLSEQSRSNK